MTLVEMNYYHVCISSSYQQLMGPTWLLNHQGGTETCGASGAQRGGVDHRAAWKLKLNTPFALHTAPLKHPARCDGSLRDTVALPPPQWPPPWLLSIGEKGLQLHLASVRRCWHCWAWHATHSWPEPTPETQASQAQWDRGEMEIKVAPRRRSRVWRSVRGDILYMDVCFRMLLYIIISTTNSEEEQRIDKNPSQVPNMGLHNKSTQVWTKRIQ